MKQPLKVPENKKFNLKLLVAGVPKVGKTHFAATYTKGPIHYYMIDPGGEKPLYKLLPTRSENCQITIDTFNPKTDTYETFWNQLRKDEKAGFFQYMAEKEGLIVLPDSLTALNDMIITHVCKLNDRDLNASVDDKRKCFRTQDWGQAAHFMKALVATIHTIPGAVMALAHIRTEKDREGTILGRYPSITGEFKKEIGKDFDEVYMIEQRQGKRILYATNYNLFQAGSRTIELKEKLEDPTMDHIYNLYMKGELMK